MWPSVKSKVGGRGSFLLPLPDLAAGCIISATLGKGLSVK